MNEELGKKNKQAKENKLKQKTMKTTPKIIIIKDYLEYE
jgi:hypothetical protein